MTIESAIFIITLRQIIRSFWRNYCFFGYLRFLDNQANLLLLLVQNNLSMGCGSSDLDSIKLNKKRETVFGVLEVKLQEAVIEHETSTIFSMDPYVNVKFSNQKQTGAVIKKGGKNPKFNDAFKFIVNSCYKFYGRCLEIELMDSNTTSDSLIGYGIIDLDPYINALQVKSPEPIPGQVIVKPIQTIELRCFLNYDRKQAGFIKLSATFREEKVDIINFRFETADFKRSTRTFGDMNCSVRVTAGEQILQTKKSLDTKLSQPNWKDQFLTFHCPTSLEHILIEVMDEENIVGSITIPKLDFLKQAQELSFEPQIMYKQEGAGKLKFNSLVNMNPSFKLLQGEYRKKTPEERLAPQAQPQQKKPEEIKPEVNKPEQHQQKPEQKKQSEPLVEKKPEEPEVK